MEDNIVDTEQEQNSTEEGTDSSDSLREENESLKKQILGLKHVISRKKVEQIFGGNDEQSLNDRKRFEELDQTVRDDILKFCQNNDFSPKAADAFVRHEMRMVADAEESDRKQQEQIADYQNKVNQLKATDVYKQASPVMDGLLEDPKLSDVDINALKNVFENPSAKIALYNLFTNELSKKEQLMKNINQDVRANDVPISSNNNDQEINDDNFDSLPDSNAKLSYALLRSKDCYNKKQEKYTQYAHTHGFSS